MQAPLTESDDCLAGSIFFIFAFPSLFFLSFTFVNPFGTCSTSFDLDFFSFELFFETSIVFSLTKKSNIKI